MTNHEKERGLIYRIDGRIEWECEHGIGHTIYAPRIKQYNGDYHENWIHGCDGCCNSKEVSQLINKLQKK